MSQDIAPSIAAGPGSRLMRRLDALCRFSADEGSLTRLAAVFQSRGSDPVGPVRSARSSDVRLFGLLNKPLFASSGGNAGVRAELADSTLIDVGQSTYPDVYYRADATLHGGFMRNLEAYAGHHGAELVIAALGPRSGAERGLVREPIHFADRLDHRADVVPPMVSRMPLE